MVKKSHGQFFENVQQAHQQAAKAKTSQQNEVQQAVAEGIKENKPARELQNASHRQSISPTQNTPHRPTMESSSQQYRGQQLGKSRNPNPVQTSGRTSTEHGRHMANTQPRPDGHDKAQDVFSRDAQAKARQTMQSREKTQDKGREHER